VGMGRNGNKMVGMGRGWVQNILPCHPLVCILTYAYSFRERVVASTKLSCVDVVTFGRYFPDHSGPLSLVIPPRNKYWG